MTITELTKKIETLQEWEALEAEAKAMIEGLKDEIKAEMDSRKTEELESGPYIVRWTSVLSNRFDTTAFKKEHSEMYKLYTKQISSRRFTVSK